MMWVCWCLCAISLGKGLLVSQPPCKQLFRRVNIGHPMWGKLAASCTLDLQLARPLSSSDTSNYGRSSSGCERSRPYGQSYASKAPIPRGCSVEKEGAPSNHSKQLPGKAVRGALQKPGARHGAHRAGGSATKGRTMPPCCGPTFEGFGQAYMAHIAYIHSA